MCALCWLRKLKVWSLQLLKWWSTQVSNVNPWSVYLLIQCMRKPESQMPENPSHKCRIFSWWHGCSWHHNTNKLYIFTRHISNIWYKGNRKSLSVLKGPCGTYSRLHMIRWRPWLPSKAAATICSGVFSTRVERRDEQETGAERFHFLNTTKHFCRRSQEWRVSDLDGDKANTQPAASGTLNI